MRKMLLAAARLLAARAPAAAVNKTTHTIMTANVRVTGLEADEQPGLRWDDRKAVCRDVILSRKPDIICMQEVIYDSWAYFKKELKGYTGLGFEGPEMDPYTEGYHFIAKNCIFFRTSRYELLGAGVYWMSEDPVTGGSISWDSARARHTNWVRLRDKVTGEQFRVLSTHLDHITEDARQQQARFIIHEAEQYAEDFPQVLCGDFNSGIKSVAIKSITEAGWHDMWEEMNGEVEYGFTAHGFKAATKKKPGRRIDFIFGHGPVHALSAEVVTDHPKGIYPSDHYFVCSEVKIGK